MADCDLPTKGPTPDLDLSLFGDEHVRRYRETDGEVGYLWNGAPVLRAHHHPEVGRGP